jgi:hypothetical protein
MFIAVEYHDYETGEDYEVENVLDGVTFNGFVIHEGDFDTNGNFLSWGS